jgi:hypothetical protein
VIKSKEKDQLPEYRRRSHLIIFVFEWTCMRRSSASLTSKEGSHRKISLTRPKRLMEEGSHCQISSKIPAISKKDLSFDFVFQSRDFSPRSEGRSIKVPPFQRRISVSISFSSPVMSVPDPTEEGSHCQISSTEEGSHRKI